MDGAEPPFPLAAALCAALDDLSGSAERDHIKVLVGRAARVSLDGGLTSAVASTALLAPESLERNLGFVNLMGMPSLWLEYPHAVRVSPTGDGRVPADVGCLLTNDPDDPGHVAAFTCWRFEDGALHHSYALLHWHMEDFRALEELPETDGGAASADRLLGLASAQIPPGLRDEMAIWQNIPEGDYDAMQRAARLTEREAVGEHVFLLSALLMLASNAVELTSLPPEDEDDPIPRWTAALKDPSPHRWPWTKRGYGRKVLGAGLTWLDPRPIARAA